MVCPMTSQTRVLHTSNNRADDMMFWREPWAVMLTIMYHSPTQLPDDNIRPIR